MKWKEWCEPAIMRDCPKDTMLYERSHGSPWCIAVSDSGFRLFSVMKETTWNDMEALNVPTFAEACVLAETILRLKGVSVDD